MRAAKAKETEGRMSREGRKSRRDRGGRSQRIKRGTEGG